MTTIQKKKILIKIQNLEKDIETLEKTRLEILTSGYASATMSSGGGSKSYTRLDADKISSAIDELKKQLSSYRKTLSGDGSGISQIYTVYGF